MKARFLALAALVLGLASCQTEPEGLNVNVGGEVDTTITVTIPDTETRAGGNNSAEGVFDNGALSGNATMRYIFQVYYNNNGDVVESQAEPQVKYSDGKSVNFDVRLVPDRDYTFVVWADVVDNETDVDKHYITRNDEGKINLRNITVNKDSWVAMDESRDAFTVTEVINDYNGQMGINLELKRALAKLRVITTDMKALNDLQIEPTYATVAYSTDHYSTFNAVDGTCSGKIEDMSHNYFIAPYADHKGNTSKVLFTDYFFANKQDEVVNFTLNVYDQQGYDEVTNTYTKNDDYIIKTNNFNTAIPAQRNYLTTISGNVLTDGNNIKVDVTDAFENASNLEDEPYYVEIWDGKTIKVPAQNEAGNYVIERGSELAWLAAAVNGTLETRAAAADSFAGETFVLTQDIDLGGEAWTPIGSNGNIFKGTFDGQNHVVANLVVRGGNNSDQGLFGVTHDGEIKNLVVENANVTGRLNVGVVAGNPYTSKYTNITVQGHVEVNGMAYVGGVGGKNAYADWTNITVEVDETSYVKANSVENGTAYRTYVGGVVGFNGEGGHKFTNITSNIDVKGSTCDVGGLFGIAHYGNKFENCSCSGDVEIYAAEEAAEAEEIGGIAGVWHNENNTTVTMTNVEFTGNVATNIARETVWYNNLVGKPYSATGTGKLIVNGAEMVANGVLKTGENEYGIYSAHGLKWIADVVNATTPYTATLFDNATVKLMNDIDLNNQEWIPIGDDRSQRTEWHGVFDGNGYTVKNIKITKKTDRDDENKSSYGLFGNVKGTVKNLTVENVSISGAPKFIGALIGRLNGGLVENCHVKNSSVECENWTIGGLVGQFNNGKISGCTVENTTVKGYAAVGGITGIALDKGERVIENCSVNSCTFVKNGSFGGDYDKMFGTIVGALYNGGLTVNLNKCTSSNNTLDGEAYSIPCGFIKNGDTLLVDGGVYIADGLTYKTAEKAYYVTNANGLVYLSNKGLKTGETVKLGADIDLTGVEFNGLDTFHPENGTTFDGQGHTVSNWTNNSGASDMGFIRNWVGPIKNVKFDNCHLKTSGRSAIAAAKVYGDIENVTINNCSLEDSYWACGLVAGLYNAGNISNCTVTNSSVKSNGGTGAIVGVINESAGTRKVENCKVEGCTVNNTGAYGDAYSGALICGMINISNSTVEFNGCSYKDNTKIGEYVGDLYYSADTDIAVKIDGGIVVNTVEEFTAALKDANVNAIVLGQDITVTEKWDNRYTGAKTSKEIIINGNGNTLKFACEVSDGFNYQAAFRFEAPAVVKNLTIDMSEVAGTGSWLRAISTKGDITVDNCTFIGSTNYTSGRGIAYGEGAGAAAGDIVVSVTNSIFTNWTRRGLTDNESAQDAKNVTVTNNTFTNAGCYVSAHDSIVFTGNTMNSSAANFRSYSNATDATVVATGNTLDANMADYNIIRGFVTANVNCQEGFTIL